MVYERTGYAPWSLTREAGVQSATVDSQIQVPQYLQPIVDTGIIDEKGDWKGIKSSDEQFIGLTTAESIPNGGEVLFPDTNDFPSIDMTGFNDINLAFRVSNGGSCSIIAVMGPDTEPYANLSPVNSAQNLKGVNNSRIDQNVTYSLFEDTSENMTADVWNIFMIMDRLRTKKHAN